MFYSGNIVRIKRTGDMFNELAIVDGSYATLYHSMCSELVDRHYHQYRLLHFGGNASSWYLENELELVSNGSAKLITAWCERYKSGYDIVDKMISKGDIVKYEDKYYLCCSVVSDAIFAIPISDYYIKDYHCTNGTLVNMMINLDINECKYIMTIKGRDAVYFDILSTTLDYSWGI